MTFMPTTEGAAEQAAPLPPADLALLADMMAWRRPAGSKTERRWIKEFLEPLGLERDARGNLWKRIGNAPVMWCCHTDTVHGLGGPQRIEVRDGMLRLAADEDLSNCLGADDTAGCWLMIEMIKAGRPGLYVFHRDEESGGRGSEWIVENNPDLLAGIMFAIAFDRKGTKSVITHQIGGRCCSDAFAWSLARQLGPMFEPDATGTFTDTANFTELVGECTNISVGYYDQHTRKERLDIAAIARLRLALLNLDWTKLVFKRAPGEPEPRFEAVGGGHRRAFDPWDDEDHFNRFHGRYHQNTILDLVRDYPHDIAELLSNYGLTAEALEEELGIR
jgi:acetylornithine deacetylase/succinyl-diaminopimelate desuccinylase-like protein